MSFVGILFLIAGAFNLVWGLVALGVSLGGTDETVVGDLSQGNLEGLGIAGLIVGALQVYAGAGILNRSPSARTIGMILAGIVIVLNIVIILILSLRHDEFVYERR